MSDRPGATGEAVRAEGGRIADDILSTLPRPTSSRELVLGIFVLMGIAGALTTLLTLTEPATFRGRYFLYSVVADAGGVRRGDPVQLRGVNIGRVLGFEIAPGGVSMRLEIEREYSVPEGSTASLRSGGLLGGMIVEIAPGAGSATLVDGDTVPAQKVEGLIETMERVGDEAGRALSQAQALLSDETVEAFGKTVKELQTLVGQLAAAATEQRGMLHDLSQSLSRSADGVERVVVRPELERAVARADSISAALEDAAAALSRGSAGLDAILARIERGEGTLGRLSRDDALYNNLTQTFESLALLLNDIRANPSRYLNIRVF